MNRKIKTKENFLTFFRKNHMPEIKEIERREFAGSMNREMRRKFWKNLIQSMIKERTLDSRAVEWVCPW